MPLHFINITFTNFLVVAGYSSTDKLTQVCESKREKGRQLQKLKLAALLLERGALVDVEDYSGMTALLHAIQDISKNNNAADIKMIELLGKHNANFYSSTKVNPLSLSVTSPEVLEYILQKDPSGINQTDYNGDTPIQTLLKNYDYNDNFRNIIDILTKYGAYIDAHTISIARTHNHRFTLIETLLDLVPSYNINTRDSEDNTLLIHYSFVEENVRKLLQRGADINAVSNDGSNALFTAVSKAKEPISIVSKLLEAGADPFLLNRKNQSIVSIVCEKMISSPVHESNNFELLQMILNLPCFTDPSINIPPAFNNEYHPQTIALKNLPVVQNRLEIYRILKLILKSNFKNPYLVIQSFVTDFEDLIFNTTQNLNPTSYFLNASSEILFNTNGECVLKKETFIILNLMLHSGFLENILEETVSPLTILLSLTYRGTPMSLVYHVNDNEEEAYGYPYQHSMIDESEDQHSSSISAEEKFHSEILMLVETLINHKVNVEDMSAEIEIQECDIMSESERFKLKKLRQLLWLPDALWVSFLRLNVQAVKILFPYWCGHPLFLFLFNNTMNYNQIMKFLPMFLKYGGIPLGTAISKLLQHFVADIFQRYGQHIILGQDAEVWESLNEILSKENDK